MLKMGRKRIGIIDADLLDHGTRHPNLALMKISGYYKDNNPQTGCGEKCDVELIWKKIKPDDLMKLINDYDLIFVSKVFNFSKTPFDNLIGKEVTVEHPYFNNIHFGGTGFFEAEAPKMINEIEHHMPDYDLYKEWVESEISSGKKANKFIDYTEFSIGFTTRGCFRKCEFCVNRNCNKVVRHSKVNEFLDTNKPRIFLWDDNVLGYSGWREIFDELDATKKPFQFRQGLDFRLITDEKAERLSHAKWYGDFIFAFDNWKDRVIIEKNLKIWKKHNPKKSTKFYLFCGFKLTKTSNQKLLKDVKELFYRIRILMKYGCVGYVMRHIDYLKHPLGNIYVQIARWCNQQQFYKKMSFWEYVYRNQSYYEEKTLKLENIPHLKNFSDFEKDLNNGYYNNIPMCKTLKTFIAFLDKYKSEREELLELFNLKMSLLKNPSLWES